MEDNEKEQAAEPVQEQDPLQAADPEQGLAPDQENKTDKKDADKKGDGLLLPVLYALLAAIGAFTLVMFIGIGITLFKNRAAAPSNQPSYSDTAQPSQAAAEE